MKWSIRLKFLLVMSALLATCLGIYLLLSVAVFKTDKTQLVYDLNRSQVSNLASEVETGLNGVSQKLKLFAQLPSNLQSKMVEDLFAEDSEIVAISLYKPNSDEPLRSFTQQLFLETYGLKKENFNELISKNKIPFETIMKEGEDIWNASVEGAPPMIGFGRLVLLLDEKGVPVDQWTVIGYMKLDQFLKSVSIVRLSEIMISNRRGEVLVQSDAENLFGKPSLAEDRLFQSAVQSNTRLSVSNLEIENQKWLAAYAKAFDGKIIVTAKAPEKEVFKAVKELTTRTLLFGSIILTLVILAAFLISRSLTQNIALLVERMAEVSKGDLTTNIHLKGRDETVSLGESFNQMIHDLKQSRDELEIMNRELDKKVKERTLQLEEQNQKVKEAQEALLRTTRLASMGEIAGRTAHEVLNPLTSLLTRAGLMQQKLNSSYEAPLNLLEEIRAAWDKDFNDGGFETLVKNWKEPSQVDPNKSLFIEDMDNIGAIKKNLVQNTEDFSKDMKFIKEEGERIGKIIHSMRRLGNMKSEARSHSLHEILSDSIHIMADLYDQKGFKVEKSFEAEMDRVLVDRDEIVQAVTNLLRNSLQALEQVSKESNHQDPLRVKLRTLTENDQLWVEIEDNGVGIEKENQSNLFETNFTTKSPDEGTGVGLSISRRFVRGYDGDMEFVSSVPRLKTVFRIRLPIHKPGHKGKASA